MKTEQPLANRKKNEIREKEEEARLMMKNGLRKIPSIRFGFFYRFREKENQRNRVSKN